MAKQEHIHEQYKREAVRDPEEIKELASGNPFDINLLDNKEAILFQGTLNRFNFDDYAPY